jgi:hypothetical protein
MKLTLAREAKHTKNKLFAGFCRGKAKEVIKDYGPMQDSNSLPLASLSLLDIPLIPLSQGAISDNLPKKQCVGSLHYR